MARLANSNPVPDIERIDLVRVGSASYLAVLEQRRSDVKSQNFNQAQREMRRRPMVPLIAAAVAVVVLGAAIYLTTPASENTGFIASPTVASAVDALPTPGGGSLAPAVETTIERFLAAEDYDTLAEVVSTDWLAARAPSEMTEIDNGELARRWSDYWAAEATMGVERVLDVDTCRGKAETILRCNVKYTSIITRALGEPYVERTTFKLVDNKIEIGDLPAPTTLVLEFEAYARSVGIGNEFDELCTARHPDNLRLANHRRPGPPCVDLMIENLGRWAQHVSKGEAG
jgi:hypothetical protein